MSHTPNVPNAPKKTPNFVLPAVLGLAGFTALGLILVQEGRYRVNSAAEILTPEQLGIQDFMQYAAPVTGSAAPRHPTTTQVASSRPEAKWTFTPPMVLEQVTPTYPRIAKLIRAQGPVEINLHVDAKGRPVEAKVLSGQLPLREGALKAAQAWRFKPAYENGRAVPSDFRIRFEFRMS